METPALALQKATLENNDGLRLTAAVHFSMSRLIRPLCRSRVCVCVCVCVCVLGLAFNGNMDMNMETLALESV